MRRWVVLVLFGACGRIGFSEQPAPGDGGDPDAVQVTQRPRAWTSGTRLRAHVLAGGGAFALRGWYDTVLDTPCTFTSTADGERCVSTQRLFRSSMYYADATCTQSLYQAQSPSCGTAKPYVVNGAPNVTNVTAGVPHAGAVYQMPGCTLVTPTTTLYDLAQAIDLATLVGATTTRIDAAGVGFIEWVADDGARELASELRDLSTGMTCVLDADVPGPASCVPQNVPQGTPVFLDAACTQPAMLGPTAGSPAWLSVPPADFCSDDRVYYPVMQSVAATTVYHGTACTALAPGTGAAVYRVGAAKARTGFPSGTIETSGTSRLVERTWVSDRLELPLGHWDSVERVVCYYGPSDGATTSRCLPDTTHSYAQTLALDATCLSFAYHTADCRPPTYNPYGLSPACDHSTNTPPVLGTASPTPHTNISGTCVPVQAPLNTNFYRYSGQSTPAGSFQLMTLTVE